MQRLNGSSYTGYLTGKGNFRCEVAKQRPYKGNRNQPKPYWYQAIRDYLVQRYNAVIVDGIEADDAIAIEGHENPSAIIVSRDKDLLQCMNIVYVYPCGKQEEALHTWVTAFISAYHFFLQVLTGDTTDNYQGLPGIGGKKASSILLECVTVRELWASTVLAYTEHYGENWHEHFLEQATLAWMVRELDQDGKPITPKLNGEFYENYYRN